VEPWAAATFTNTVTVASDTEDPTPDNSFDSESTEVGVPTAVTVFGFEVDHVDDMQVFLIWELAGGFNLYGFNLYRSSLDDFGTAEWVDFVPASGSGAYGTDDLVPESGDWWYWITLVSNSGGESPPISVVRAPLVGFPYKIYLPLWFQ
jgi:hypothetical protein